MTEPATDRSRNDIGPTGPAAAGRILAAASLLVVAAACGDDGLGPEDAVTLNFRSSGGAATSAVATDGGTLAASRTIDGTNGTLVLETMHVVMEEFELEREDADDCDVDDDACESFELGPLLVEIPLEEGSTVTAFSATVPEDRYRELEFEIDDLDDDEPGEVELLEEIRDDFPHWPEDASLRMTGTFTPDGGSATDFLAYFAAEVEIELEFEPFLAVTEETGAEVDVTVDPSPWFSKSDGTVVELSRFHCDPPNECPVPEFEVELEREGPEAFTEIEWN